MTNDVSTPEVRYFQATGIYQERTSRGDFYLEFDKVRLHEVSKSASLTKGKESLFLILTGKGANLKYQAPTLGFSASNALENLTGQLSQLISSTKSETFAASLNEIRNEVVAVIDVGLSGVWTGNNPLGWERFLVEAYEDHCGYNLAIPATPPLEAA